MRLMATVSQRIEDVMREIRICALADAAVAERRAGRLDLAYEAVAAMTAEIAKRSPEQVARMEAKLGG